MKIDPEVAQKVTLPTFAPAIEQSSVETFVKTARAHGLIDKDISYDDLVWSGTAG